MAVYPTIIVQDGNPDSGDNTYAYWVFMVVEDELYPLEYKRYEVTKRFKVRVYGNEWVDEYESKLVRNVETMKGKWNGPIIPDRVRESAKDQLARRRTK